MSTPVTLPQVVEFLTSHADDHDLTVVFQAVKDRRAALAQIAAAAIRVGSTVKTVRLKPRYMEGLTGEVTAIETRRAKKAATVLLDEASSAQVDRNGGADRYASIDPTTGRREIGVPLNCLILL